MEASKDLSINSLAEELNEWQQGRKSKHEFFCNMVKRLSDDHQDLVAQLKTVLMENFSTQLGTTLNSLLFSSLLTDMEASKDLSINSLAEELRFRKGLVYEDFMKELNAWQQGSQSKHDFFCNMVKRLTDDHQDLVAQLKTVLMENFLTQLGTTKQEDL